MSDSISIALSGLLAQSRSLSVSANNIANITTAGAVPTVALPKSNVYKAQTVDFKSLMSNGVAGGVIASVKQDKGFSLAFNPSSIYANKDGLIAVPNVDLTKEIVTIMQTKQFYKANLSVIKAQKDMLGELLDAIT